PFIFGRGGEELDELRRAGVEVEVINGITTGLYASTALGTALTHREQAHGVEFVTGHAHSGHEGVDWTALATTAHQARLTLVIYMGMQGVGAIQRGLLQGLPATTPVAVVQDASLPTERQLLTVLASLEQTILDRQFRSPGIIVVGDVLQGLLAARSADPLTRRA
ncbi:MAG: uroporphyrinogen-III C-methyltransferase, partial [Rhodoferax sp.]|nr:uroporphyrinogen-III C-methyltransferase [Rhodoferax sp.]